MHYLSYCRGSSFSSLYICVSLTETFPPQQSKTFFFLPTSPAGSAVSVCSEIINFLGIRDTHKSATHKDVKVCVVLHRCCYRKERESDSNLSVSFISLCRCYWH